MSHFISGHRSVYACLGHGAEVVGPLAHSLIR